MNKFLRILKHRWLDGSDTHRLIPDAMAQRLAQRIGTSEIRHTGEIRLCVEAALPQSYLWRLGGEASLRPLVRERAMSWFGKLGVWDTQDNNGVLIYLLLAERCIEFVADRGLTARVTQGQWQAMADRLAAHLQRDDFEGGLTQAVEEMSALLVAFYPCEPGAHNPNELSDKLVRA